jgi:MscS family membrane protein
LTVCCFSCCVLQALGLEVRSVLAIGGIGGLAIGLAGREICENLLNGFLLMTTVRPRAVKRGRIIYASLY